MMLDETIKPWYKEPYVWLIIALPASAVLAGFYTLFLAVISYDGLVVDDYYKEGLAINKRLEKENNASLYQLDASIETNNNKMRLLLSGNNEFNYPETINVILSHATRQGFDQTLFLQRKTMGVYEGQFNPLMSGHWNVILEQDNWRLTDSLFY